LLPEKPFFMEFLDLARKRFSARGYEKRPVEEAKLKKILEAGRIAPSAANLQPWHFIVVSEPENLQKLHVVYGKDWFREAPVILVICGDHSRSWKRPDGKDHCDIDLAIAADHMTLQAAELELGTCWICNFDRLKCAAILGLPAYIEPAIILTLGYPAASPDLERHTTKRKRIEEIVHKEKFISQTA
jgi:nitroreductase